MDLFIPSQAHAPTLHYAKAARSHVPRRWHRRRSRGRQLDLLRRWQCGRWGWRRHLKDAAARPRRGPRARARRQLGAFRPPLVREEPSDLLGVQPKITPRLAAVARAGAQVDPRAAIIIRVRSHARSPKRFHAHSQVGDIVEQDGRAHGGVVLEHRRGGSRAPADRPSQVTSDGDGALNAAAGGRRVRRGVRLG